MPPTTTEDSPENITLLSRIGFGDNTVQTRLDPRYDFTSSTDVAKSIFDLGNKLTKLMLQTRNAKFEVISPLSIASALNVVLLGSKGDTFNELLSFLGYSKCKYVAFVILNTVRNNLLHFRLKFIPKPIQSS